jgi:peptide/bleomycin uptake transporter
MIREYFRSKTWPFAFAGLIATLLHCLLKAYVKYLLNDWFREFYDAGGSASEIGSGDSDALNEGRQNIINLLYRFAEIAFCLVILNPIFRFIGNCWILHWRITLVKSYLQRWPSNGNKVENGAQRVHEDTSLRARGIQDCVIVIIDSIMTLLVFLPVLLDVGSKVRFENFPPQWLIFLVVTIAFFGAFVSMCLGWSLISLEVNNQMVEAELRKKLVLQEESGNEMAINSYASTAHGEELLSSFRGTIRALRYNYLTLYRQMALFSVWLSTFEQAVIILPYAMAAPLLFAEGPTRITLGLVTQTSHAFGNVFDSVNILSSNWTTVTDFLSTWRRLKEWEAVIDRFPLQSERPLIQSQLSSEMTEAPSQEEAACESA